MPPDCEAGTYSAHEGQDECDVCPGDESSANASSYCTGCRAGQQSQRRGGRFVCDECPDGHRSRAGGKCEACR